MSLWGVKRTSLIRAQMSANDLKRTDFILDPTRPDMVADEDYCGSQARPGSDLRDKDNPSRSIFKRLWPQKGDLSPESCLRTRWAEPWDYELPCPANSCLSRQRTGNSVLSCVAQPEARSGLGE